MILLYIEFIRIVDVFTTLIELSNEFDNLMLLCW